MKNFKVPMIVSVIYDVTVTAEDKDDAEDLAYGLGMRDILSGDLRAGSEAFDEVIYEEIEEIENE